MKRILLAYTLSALCLLPAFAGGGEGALPISYVNPFIGTTNFGTTNPGAVCPNGMMSVVPFNVMGSEDNKYDKDARWWSTPYEQLLFYRLLACQSEWCRVSRTGIFIADAYYG